MRRFRRIVEENPDQALYIAEICKVIRVSDRTLRMVCQGHLGIGPKRYLLLRRMHLARRALRETASDMASVTDIATRYGFWHLARALCRRVPVSVRRVSFGHTPPTIQ
jgi:AraC-like DNA-binding protein